MNADFNKPQVPGYPSHARITCILSQFGSQVYGYNPGENFNFSFGEDGDDLRQFSLSTGMPDFTGQDDLVDSDVYRVDLFDAEWTYLGESFTIDDQLAGGSRYGMTIDSHGSLYYISSGGRLLKFVINYPAKND